MKPIALLMRFLLVAALMVSGSAHAYIVYIYAGGPKKVSAETEQTDAGDVAAPAPTESDPEEVLDAPETEAETQETERDF